MMLINVPTETGVVAILGVTIHDILVHSNTGQQPGPVDLTQNFEIGVPLPTVLQVLFVEDNEELMSRLRAVLPDIDTQLHEFPAKTVEDED